MSDGYGTTCMVLHITCCTKRCASTRYEDPFPFGRKLTNAASQEMAFGSSPSRAKQGLFFSIARRFSTSLTMTKPKAPLLHVLRGILRISKTPPLPKELSKRGPVESPNALQRFVLEQYRRHQSQPCEKTRALLQQTVVGQARATIVQVGYGFRSEIVEDRKRAYPRLYIRTNPVEPSSCCFFVCFGGQHRLPPTTITYSSLCAKVLYYAINNTQSE